MQMGDNGQGNGTPKLALKQRKKQFSDGKMTVSVSANGTAFDLHIHQSSFVNTRRQKTSNNLSLC